VARSDRLPREPNLPAVESDPLGWLRRLVGRLNSLFVMYADSLNLLIDGYVLHVGTAPEANANNRGRMYAIRAGSGARDRLYWIRKDADDVHRAVELADRPLVAQATVDLPSVPDGGVVAVTVTVNGASPGDCALASLSTIGAVSVLVSAHVQSADTVRVVFENRSGAAWDPAAGTLTVLVFKGVT